MSNLPYINCTQHTATGFQDNKLVLLSVAELAIAERDKRIKELESIIEDMKSCDTCKHWTLTCRANAGCSDRSEYWEPRT